MHTLSGGSNSVIFIFASILSGGQLLKGGIMGRPFHTVDPFSMKGFYILKAFLVLLAKEANRKA